MTRMCCQCQRVEQEGCWQDQWSPDRGSETKVTHGYCPDCYGKAMGEIDRYISGKMARPFAVSGLKSSLRSCEACV